MNDTNSTIQEAKALKDEGKYEESLKILREQYTKNKKDKREDKTEDIKEALIETLFEYGHHLTDEWVLEYDKAKDIFNEIIELEPENYRAHYNLGISLFYMRLYEEALSSFNEALRIKPDYKFCHYNIGLAYEEMNLFNKALKAYKRALKIDPDFAYARQGKRDIERAIETGSLPCSPEKENEAIEQLKSLMRVSKRVRITDIQDILEKNRKELLPMLVDWAEDYGLEIDGDYLILNKDCLSDFLNDIDNLVAIERD